MAERGTDLFWDPFCGGHASDVAQVSRIGACIVLPGTPSGAWRGVERGEGLEREFSGCLFAVSGG